ncbi:MAG: NADPH:quinone reductase [Ilumatobacteraceae bacterium]|nr:NADPH:quinone reductase [Ilumatobacteraceae bacterium]
MKAYVQHGFGGDLALETVPDPSPAAGELVVQVHACALNRLDLLQQAAPLVRGFALPHIAGMDVAGVVVARTADLPDDVGPPIGARVLIDPVSTCGVCVRCRSGQAPYCEDLRTVGSTRPGGYAELVAAPADRTFALPDTMSFVDAATLPVAAMTAFHALEAGQHVPGEVVLVNGAASGVSCALLTLLLADGSTVITTTGGPDKVARAEAAGYHHAIDYRSEDVAAAVAAITGGRGVDLVVDHVGPALFRESIASLAIGGRMVFCGTTTGTEATLSLTDVYHWGRSLIGAGGYEAADFPLMLDAMARAGRPPVIDSVWSFDQVPAALQAMRGGAFFGKIVVDVAG